MIFHSLSLSIHSTESTCTPKRSSCLDTPWQQLVFDIGETTLDHDYIWRMPLNKPVPVASHKGGSVLHTKSFVASLLVRSNEYDDLGGWAHTS